MNLYELFFLFLFLSNRTGDEAKKDEEEKKRRKEEKAQKKRGKKDEGEWTDVVKGAHHVVVT